MSNLTDQVDDVVLNSVTASRLRVDGIHNPTGGGNLPTPLVPPSVGVQDPTGFQLLLDELPAVLVSEEQVVDPAALLHPGDAKTPQTPTVFQQTSLANASSSTTAKRSRNKRLRWRGLAALSPTALSIFYDELVDVVHTLENFFRQDNSSTHIHRPSSQKYAIAGLHVRRLRNRNYHVTSGPSLGPPSYSSPFF